MSSGIVTFHDFNEADIPEISLIHAKQPSLGVPSLKNVIANRTIVLDGKIVGYGVVKQFSEGVLIIDEDLSIRDKAEIVKGAMRIAIASAELAGSELLYITSSHGGFRQVLKKHYGFLSCPDEFLVLNLNK